MNALANKIAEYYCHIDHQDIDWVLALFASDAVYQRADVTYRGMDAISRFFRHERQIKGTHVLDRLCAIEESKLVFVTGTFTGHGAMGDARSVRFADVWEFNGHAQIRLRQTYLALGHEYVQR
jgi:ketosteroid isomerase-like protein